MEVLYFYFFWLKKKHNIRHTWGETRPVKCLNPNKIQNQKSLVLIQTKPVGCHWNAVSLARRLSDLEKRAMVVGLRLFHQNPLLVPQVQGLATKILPLGTLNVQCSAKPAATQYNNNEKYSLRTCKNCKTQYDPALNHPRSCCYHTAHFGGKCHSLLSFLLYFILIFFHFFFFQFRVYTRARA